MHNPGIGGELSLLTLALFERAGYAGKNHVG